MKNVYPIYLLLLFSWQLDARQLFIRTEDSIVQQLYQLLKDIDELFAAKGIPYWLDGGCLLGAIRHKGFIPWDNDADICVDIKQKERLLALEPLFKKLGYFLEKERWGCRLCKNAWREKFGQVDIVYTTEKNNRIYYYDLKGWTRGDDSYYIAREELYPLKRYKFGCLELLGPNDPALALNCFYGDDWLTVGKFEVAHSYYTKETVVLSEEDKLPALPKEPLKEQVFTQRAAQRSGVAIAKRT
jgi:phosphorylcholine metabolism protein LicD